MNIIKMLFDHEYKEMRRFKKLADEIMALEDEYAKKSDDELKNNTDIFKATTQEYEKPGNQESMVIRSSRTGEGQADRYDIFR